MKRKFILYLLTGILTAVLMGGCAVRQNTEESVNGAPQTSADASGNGSARESASAPDAQEEETAEPIVFQAQDMEGNAVSSDIFSNARLTMINVWATYCNPCLREMPALGQLAGEYETSDFQLIGIISDVPEGSKEAVLDEAEGLIEQTKADYPHLLLNESLYHALLTDVTVVPTTFFLDNEGNILTTVLGSRDKTDWKEVIDELLEEL